MWAIARCARENVREYCVTIDDVSIYVRSSRNRVISRLFGIFACGFNIKASIISKPSN